MKTFKLIQCIVSVYALVLAMRLADSAATSNEISAGLVLAMLGVLSLASVVLSLTKEAKRDK